MRTSARSLLVLGVAAGVMAGAAVGFVALSRRGPSGLRGARRTKPALRPTRAPGPARVDEWERKPVPREPTPGASVAEPAPAHGDARRAAAAPERKPAGARKLVLQGYAAVLDTWLTPDYPDRGNCSVEEANVQVHTPDRTLVRFEIPPGVRGVRKATLMLYFFWVGERGGFDIAVHRVRTPWKAESATYVKPWRARGLSSGADYDSTPAASAKAPVPPRWVEFDVTHVVKAWASGEPNCGFLIKAAPWVRKGGRYQVRMTDFGRDGPKLVIETE